MPTAKCQDDSMRKPRVLKSDPWFDEQEGAELEFRLTYQGILLAERTDSTRLADHKMMLRKAFHPQLKRLWASPPLSKWKEFTGAFPSGIIGPASGEWPGPFRVEAIAKRFERCGYKFVPLVTEDLAATCGIEVLFLRSGPPGEVIKSGDLDNRLKTLIDGLRLPREFQELGDAPPSLMRFLFTVCLRMTGLFPRSPSRAMLC